MKERIGWYRLRRRVNVNDKILLKHILKYPSFLFNVYNESEIINFLRVRLSTEKYDPQEELKIMKAIFNTQKRQREIYKICRNRQLKSYSKILQQLSIERVKLKQCWGGAEYLCLPLFKEIARRNFIALSDIFSAYDTPDIINLLKNQKIIPGAEKNKRKVCYCLCFIGKQGSYQRWWGQAARNKTAALLGSAQIANVSMINGQTANPGLAHGKVHKVLVSGLKELAADISAFKAGEILVTTMTTPAMVPICKKARAIITDEGGICSHAAVVSREFGIPCIVGTHHATSILKDGDMVEVDAEKGIVRKI